jgi:hypothetical protein
MWLSDIIVRCLAKRPAERFQSVPVLLDALNAGRQSGPQDPVSAERVARKLQSEEATLMLPSAERPRASLSQTKASESPTAPPNRSTAQPAGRRLPLIMFLGLAVVVAGWLLFGKRPVLIVENRLVEPIKVVLGAETFEVPPGGKARRPVKGRGPLVAQWYLVRPAGPSGQPLGAELQGSISDPSPKGRLTFEVDGSSGDKPVFAPLITNGTDQQLTITVNAGTTNAIVCDCRVNPGATRARIGYYPLYLNSSVQAAVPRGATAAFRDLGQQVDRTTGTIGLRFEPKDFPK